MKLPRIDLKSVKNLSLPTSVALPAWWPATWHIHHRNARAIGGAGSIFIMILVMTYFTSCDRMIDRVESHGLVLEIEQRGIVSDVMPQGPACRVLLAVGDTAKVRVLLPPPEPRVGDFVPVKIERHTRSGSHYYLDTQRWLIEGP